MQNQGQGHTKNIIKNDIVSKLKNSKTAMSDLIVKLWILTGLFVIHIQEIKINQYVIFYTHRQNISNKCL